MGIIQNHPGAWPGLHSNLCISLCFGLWYNTLHVRIKKYRRYYILFILRRFVPGDGSKSIDPLSFLPARLRFRVPHLRAACFEKDENAQEMSGFMYVVWRFSFMTCKDFSSMVPGFLDDTLDNDSLRRFLDHYDDCKGCREELEIQYLVKRVFDEKSAGEELNLSKDLPEYINQERELLRRRRRLSFTAAAFESAAIAAAVVAFILYIIF